MNDPFVRKVWAAAVAGWWALLIGYALFLLSWVASLVILSARPAWLLTIWGQGEVSWSFVQTLTLWFMSIFKLVLLLLILVVLWLTLWARQLRKWGAQGMK
jgi:hypothetical protein